MFCANCGNEFADGTKFCAKCGAKVETGSSVQFSQQTNNISGIPVQPIVQPAAAKSNPMEIGSDLQKLIFATIILFVIEPVFRLFSRVMVSFFYVWIFPEGGIIRGIVQLTQLASLVMGTYVFIKLQKTIGVAMSFIAIILLVMYFSGIPLLPRPW